MSIIKKEAKKLIDTLPEQATWDDIMYEFYIKKKLTIALKAADQGNVTDHQEVKKGFFQNENPIDRASYSGFRKYSGAVIS